MSAASITRSLVLCAALSAQAPAQTSWIDVAGVSLDCSLAPIAFDPVSREFWSFGGTRGGADPTHRAETRVLRSGRWSIVPTTTTPPARAEHGFVFDSVRRRFVMFGGRTEFGQTTFRDTWEFDGTNWSLVAVSGPPGGGLIAMAFDPGRGVTVLHDVATGTWEWNGASWSLARVFGAAPRSYDATATYDPATGRVVLFGGTHLVNGLYEWDDAVWSFDGVQWTSIRPTPGPPGFKGHAFVAGPGGALHVFGGFNRWPRAEHWILSNGVWSQSSPLPVEYSYIRAAYDSGSGEIVAVGSNARRAFAAETLSWARGAWNGVPSGWPEATERHAMATDSGRSVAVMAGGSLDDRTFEWDGADWSEVAIGAGPVPRVDPTLTFHARSNRCVLFGGHSGPNGAFLAATQTWDGVTWRAPILPTEPPARSHHAAADDFARGRLVVFGGMAAPGTLVGDTWEWDGAQWSQVASTGPSARFGAAMAFDPVRGRVVLFGGSEVPFPLPMDDTWEFDGVSWSRVPVTTAPPPLESPRLVWDPLRQRLVLCGVEQSQGTYAETWELVGNGWVQRSRDALLEFGPSAFDPVSGRVISFGADGVTWSYGPDPPARTLPFGAGCPGSGGAPLTTAASGLPWLGDALTIDVGNVGPTATPFVGIGFSDLVWDGLALPFDLTPFRSPCLVWSAWIVTAPAQGAPTASLQVSIPGDPTLAGIAAYAQGLALDAANPLGIVTADALRLDIGAR